MRRAVMKQTEQKKKDKKKICHTSPFPYSVRTHSSKGPQESSPWAQGLFLHAHMYHMHDKEIHHVPTALSMAPSVLGSAIMTGDRVILSF